MTHEEVVNNAVEGLAKAIVDGNFKEMVASLIGAMTAKGYGDGLDYAVNMMLSEHKDEFVERWKMLRQRG